MSEPRISDLDIEISHDAGATWEPLRPGYEQGGRIERVDGDIVVQSVGRGRVVWYRVRERDAPTRSHIAAPADDTSADPA